MANYREIVTKAVIGKGKKAFTNKYILQPVEKPTTILGIWVINHQFKGEKQDSRIKVQGSCDVNVWYAYDNDTKTLVDKQTITYEELLNITRKRQSEITPNEEVIVRSLEQPTCTKVEIVDGKINYDIKKELGIEIVGDTKVRIAIDEGEDDWEEIIDEKDQEETMKEIDESINEQFISEENKR